MEKHFAAQEKKHRHEENTRMAQEQKNSGKIEAKRRKL